MRMLGQQRFSAEHFRRGLIGALGLVLASALVLAMARADGFSAARLTLASGQAWVASSRVGQIALIDGSTEQKVAAVTVAKPGEDISVTQGGPDALVVNRTTGSVLRVRGSTYADPPGPIMPLPGAGPGLSVFAGNGSQAFAVDTARGAAVTLDRSTMRVQQQSLSLAARLDPGATVIDAEGRLWAVDSASGDLVWFDASGKHVRRGAAASGAATRLVLVRGEPAIVDVSRRKVSLLNPANGRATSDSCLDVPPGAQVAAGGSSTAPTVFVVSSDRGVLLVSDLKSGQCSRLITLTAPGARLGDPVETGGRVFVPDYASGQVFVVDLDTGKVVADPDVLPAGLQSFDLLPRAGFVFYNDRSSQRSGVIRLDGSVSRISKYNPADPSQQTRRPTRDTASGQTLNGGDGPGTGAGIDGLGDSTRLPSVTDGPKSLRAPKSADQPQDQPLNRPPRTQPPSQRPPLAGTPTTEPSTPTVISTTPLVNISRQLQVLVSAGPYYTGSPVTFQVRSLAGPAVRSATWTFRDGAGDTGVTVTHTWTEAAVYEVIVDAVLRDGSSGRGSTTITVQLPLAAPKKPPVAKLSLSPQTATAPQTVTADASGSRDDDGSITSYTFAWGDGGEDTKSADPVASHRYVAVCNNCRVRVTVVDNDGLTDSATKTVDIKEKTVAPLDVSLAVRPAEAKVGEGVAVAMAVDPYDLGPIEYAYDWGDGASDPRGPADNASHRYSRPGTYTVTVTAYEGGQQGTGTSSVIVYPPPLAALSVSPKSGVADLRVEADGSGSSGGASSLSYTFNWGDGAVTGPQDSATASHTYRSSCTCKVRLTVTDNRSNDDTATATVTVSDPAKSAAGAQALSRWTAWSGP